MMMVVRSASGVCAHIRPPPFLIRLYFRMQSFLPLQWRHSHRVWFPETPSMLEMMMMMLPQRGARFHPEPPSILLELPFPRGRQACNLLSLWLAYR
jgi:hypothetical protein